MRNKKSMVFIVAAVMIFSFASVPPAHAFVGIAALSAILAATFASAVIVDKTIVKQENKTVPEHSASKHKTQHRLEASNIPIKGH